MNAAKNAQAVRVNSRKFLLDYTAAIAIVGVFFCGVQGMSMISPDNGVLAELVAGTQHAAAKNDDASKMNVRIAQRLASRLHSKKMPVASEKKLVAAVEQRQRILRRKADVTFTWDKGLTESWVATPQANPLWIRGNFTKDSAEFTIDPDAVLATVHDHVGSRLVAPEDAILEDVSEGVGGVLRARTVGVAKPGEILNENFVADQVVAALLSRNGAEPISVAIQTVPGQIENRSARDLGPLQLLAIGRSNFKGSSWSRIQNVKKALDDHVNNSVVAPGETYSFNDMLEGPVSTGNGWFMAKIIENGVDLVDAPGGGICQASTTVFRAMLNAGFVPEKRKAHSLYVSYYEEYGVGIDATIFPGKQDLTFVNDTENYLLMQAYYDGYDAYVLIYGQDDGREVALEGPFFAGNDQPALSDLRYNEIGWMHRVKYADGSLVENPVRSLYRAIPRSLATKYTATVHASAPEQLQ